MHVFPAIYGLTHWGRVTHICVGKLIIIGSDNGLSPDRGQAIIWTNAELLSIGPLPTYFSENLIKMQQFSLKKMHVKMLSAKWRLSCLGLNVLVRKLFSNRTSDCLAALLCFDIPVNTLRPRQNGRHSPDDIFKCIFLNENVWISIKISLKFVPKGSIENIPALVQIMAWRRPGDKPLSELMMVNLLTHICVTRPQWVNILRLEQRGLHFIENILKCTFWQKIGIFGSKFHLILFLWVQLIISKLRSGKGLALNTWQVINWTNDDPVQCGYMMYSRSNELMLK